MLLPWELNQTTKTLSVADILAYQWRYRLSHRPQIHRYRPLSVLCIVSRENTDNEKSDGEDSILLT
jgi:hypothetical protein